MAEETREEHHDEELHGVDRLRAVRIEKADALRAKGVNPYPYRFATTHDEQDGGAKQGLRAWAS